MVQISFYSTIHVYVIYDTRIYHRYFMIERRQIKTVIFSHIYVLRYRVMFSIWSCYVCTIAVFTWLECVVTSLYQHTYKYLCICIYTSICIYMYILYRHIYSICTLWLIYVYYVHMYISSYVIFLHMYVHVCINNTHKSTLPQFSDICAYNVWGKVHIY